MTVHPHRRDLPARLRGPFRALLAGLLASLMVFFAALGGTAYVFCVPMERAQLTCCCPRRASHELDRAAHDTRAPAALTSTCCEGRRVSSLPPTIGAPHVDAWVPPPVLAAFLPLLLWLAAPEEPGEATTFARGRQARAGPEPPVYARCCSYLI